MHRRIYIPAYLVIVRAQSNRMDIAAYADMFTLAQYDGIAALIYSPAVLFDGAAYARRHDRSEERRVGKECRL